MLSDDLKADCRKFKVTAKKYGGDDQYSWAVFVDGSPWMTGLSKYEVDGYKRSIVKMMKNGERRP